MCHFRLLSYYVSNSRFEVIKCRRTSLTGTGYG
jgi:hypothetical protein